MGNACPRNASVKAVKVVNERENVLANELVMMIREEDRGNVSRVLVSHDILDEWSFLSYKENSSMCATDRMIYEVLSDASSDYQFTIACEKEKIDDRGEKFYTSNLARPSDLKETINQIWKVHCQWGKIKKKKLITRKVSVNKKQKTKKVSRHNMTKEIESLSNEVVNDGDEVLEIVKEKDDTTQVVQIKEFEKKKIKDVCVSNVDFEVGGYENGKDLMSILKEQNEAIVLKST
ncbi:hypothetical protein PIB30_063639 [Stylosanthes scabra]|uniref:Uncharacterized protein n=1 Tax=Stylosanthes scabra TaxID=79078 RepID=A0ABU6UMF7_9FABA|nr:hypothetical protein [Stylosanthes scabra]